MPGYLNQLATFTMRYGGQWTDNLAVRWVDEVVEVVDMNDEYVLSMVTVWLREYVSYDVTEEEFTIDAGGTIRTDVSVWKNGIHYQIINVETAPRLCGDVPYYVLRLAPYVGNWP